MYWRELARVPRQAVAAAAILSLLAAPQVFELWAHGPEMTARFRQISALSGANPLLSNLNVLIANWLSHFTTGYLFVPVVPVDRLAGTVCFMPAGFVQLFPEQAILITFAAFAMLHPRWRRLGIVLSGWLAFAAIPPALTIGAPDNERNLMAFAPWMLASALGFVAALDALAYRPRLAALVAAAFFAGAVLHSGKFVKAYFLEYPAQSARFFQYGVDQAVLAASAMSDAHEPIVVTSEIEQPYIYVLFFERYPPRAFQQARKVQMKGLFGPVLAFDRWIFLPPRAIYPRVKRGVFVFSANEDAPVPPVMTVRYPDRAIAYKLVVK